MSDLISRKAAIKAIRKDMYADKDFMSAMICEGIEYMLNGVPSAEPERKKPDHGYMWICPECGLEVHSDFTRCVRCGWDRPSAEPERKRGKWVSDGECGILRCDRCGAPSMNVQNFCYKCGADMRGGEDEAD